MNNKLLILALFTLVSGCSTTNTSVPLMTGTGAGSPGMGIAQKQTSPSVPVNTYPSYSSPAPFPSDITENNFPSPTISKSTQSRYPSKKSSVEAVKKYNPENTNFEKTAVLNQSQSAKNAKAYSPNALSSKKIKVEVIRTNSHDKVYLQLGVFSSLANAKTLQKKVVANQMPEPIIKEVILNGKLAHCVQLGPILSTAKVNEFNAKLAKMGISETWYVTENKIQHD